MPDADLERTDWDTYYSAPVPLARLTRLYTQRVLLRLMREHARGVVTSICELGGANSCFYDAIRRAYPDATYTAIDNNELGLRLLQTRAAGDPKTRTLLQDLIVMPRGLARADIVFSVGLIEHFTREGTAVVIARHFDCAAPGGLVIITFPTPTRLYRSLRLMAEWAGAWRFPDERPLRFDEVLGEVRRYGDVLEVRLNWPTLLTQGVIAARAPSPALAYR